MKLILKILLVVFLVFMLILTILAFTDDMKLLFTYESAEYLSDISNVNVFFSVLFLIVYLFMLIYFWKRLKLVLPFLFFIALLWLISGRTLAFKYHPTGRVIIGWYYVETEIFNLCKENQDYESILANETIINELPFWRLNLKNKDVDKTIFIGPFVWDETVKILKKRIKFSSNNS
ncbi:hypothetical protein EH230_07805 [Flavobacterium columnare]|uniref:Uncharacterized protein n=1 Tax=Flavobacterium columnare TaxID=996 RepID=A0A437UB20_9FLAO|nr:hypothetical protein [Flavobacterium columnare]RVU90811.1 hypothetical protein EH230_07805 [Flavobacterium columnare]